MKKSDLAIYFAFVLTATIVLFNRYTDFQIDLKLNEMQFPNER